MAEDNKTKRDETSTKVKKPLKKKTDLTDVIKPGLEEKKPAKRRRRRRKPAKKLPEVTSEVFTDQTSKESVSEGQVSTETVSAESSDVVSTEPSESVNVEAFSAPTSEETEFAFQDEEIPADEIDDGNPVDESEKEVNESEVVAEPAVESVPESISESVTEPKESTPFESWGPGQEKPISSPEPSVSEQSFVAPEQSYTSPVQPFSAPQEPVFPSPGYSAPSNMKEPVGWGDTNGFHDIGGVDGVANAATESNTVETTDWFTPAPEEVKEPESGAETEPVEKSEPEVVSKWETESESVAESGSKVQTSTVQDVTSEVVSVENEPVGQSSSEEKSSFMNLLAEAGIKKKHLFMVGGVLFTIILVILIAIFSYDSGTSGIEKAVEQVKKTEEVKKEKETEKEQEESVGESAKESKKESNEELTAQSTDDFQISGLINSYIFGLEFTQDRVLPMLDTTPISEEGTLVGIDSSLAAGQSLQFKQETIAQSLDLLLKIENARKLDIYDYLNRTTDRVAALNEHIRDLQVLLTTAEAQKNVIVAQITTLNSEYAQITAQKSSYEKAFFTSVNNYYGKDSYNNLILFTEASQLQVKVKANYNALKTLNAMFDTSIKVLGPRINDIVLNFDALVAGVQVTEVKNSNINAIKF